MNTTKGGPGDTTGRGYEGRSDFMLTKIKKAIAYFEDAIRKSDDIISECSEALRKAREALDYWRELYGIGLEVLNWHMNGDIETFDSFYDSSGTYEALAEIDKAIGGREE